MDTEEEHTILKEESDFCDIGYTVKNALTECETRIELEEQGLGCNVCVWFKDE